MVAGLCMEDTNNEHLIFFSFFLLHLLLLLHIQGWKERPSCLVASPLLPIRKAPSFCLTLLSTLLPEVCEAGLSCTSSLFPLTLLLLVLCCYLLHGGCAAEQVRSSLSPPPPPRPISFFQAAGCCLHCIGPPTILP